MQLGRQRELVPPVPDGAFGPEYALVRRAIEHLEAPHGSPAVVGDLAPVSGVSPAELERALLAWCGLSTAAFTRALTREHIRERLARAHAWPDGLGRIHDFEVRIAATVTDEGRRRGTGLDIAYGFHGSPFGKALLLTTEDGICGLAFIDEDAEEGQGRRAALDDMMARWPRACFHEAPEDTGEVAARIFATPGACGGRVVPLVLIGTPFDLQVWQALLRIPLGQLGSYTQIAQHLGRPSASRAVGTANGRNPISFVVPCHRALRGDGSLGGYYWGLTRKRAMIAWETGRAEARASRTNRASAP